MIAACLAITGAVFITGPLYAQGIWSLWSNEPLIPWLIRQQVDISMAVFFRNALVAIGVILLLLILWALKGKRWEMISSQDLSDLRARHKAAQERMDVESGRREKERRQEIRDEISSYLIVADKLKRQCADVDRCEIPTLEADEWYAKVATYISENVSYADKNRFISDTNTPTFPPLEHPSWAGRIINDSERQRVWQFLHKRAYQLAKILDELKPLS